MSIVQHNASAIVFVNLRGFDEPLPVATIKKPANAACSKSLLKLATVLQATSAGFGFRFDAKEK